ncbi:hypothetical protein BLBBOR_093 [Blattabacterium sp. (Blatta orientalis) str. Tarazona]|uniref:hypothetical protein n=1 Tax=Blattabacterium sp. (Blatta orientalis) TaxID=367806 RepID=UPI0002AD8F7F|nr:hypothetical protein [Blattabacterium sp. (Blatta orientalis)]AGD98003.1 hypothetical protein BLBBOR_093 [Blattabacterium sp. (Blatta orientalis) str. Tarazona]
MEEYPIYTLFPNGLQLFLYEKGKDKYTYLSANWVKSTEKFFYHLKGKIIIMNPNGDFLKTEEIYWNRKRKKYLITYLQLSIVLMEQYYMQ